MKATFTLTEVDLTRLQNVVVKRVRAKTGVFSWPFALRVIVWMCIGFGGSASVRIMRQHPEISGPLVTVAVVTIIALLTLIALPYVAQASVCKHLLLPNGAFLSPQTVQFSEISLHISLATGKTEETPWTAMLARDEDESNYYLFVDAAQAFILPRSAMAPFAPEFERYTAHLKSA
jgi:hypothetical protein